MANKKSGLGMGIEAIFEDNGVVTQENEGVVRELRVTQIEPNHDQPRKEFDKQALSELAESILEHGVLCPIIVRPLDNGQYRIVAGERRWRASKLAGLKTMPAQVVNYDDKKCDEIALIENLQREDLNAIEESLGYEQLKIKYELSQDEIAKRVGKSRPAVANALRLLALPVQVRELVQNGSLSAGHARAILGCENEQDMLTLAQKAVAEHLSVRQVERLAKQGTQRQPAPRNVMFEKYISDEFEQKLSQSLGRKVHLATKSGKGVLEIEFYDSEDLNELIEKMGIDIQM